MRHEQIALYQYDELSDEAKEVARNWYREGWDSYDWWDAVYEDFVRVSESLGVEVDKDGGRYKIYFSGFCSQGDGAAFNGSYRYQKGAAKAIRKYAPLDKELHEIADQLQEVQRRHFYRLRATITSGRGNNISVDVYDAEDRYKDVGKDEGVVRDILNDLAHWLYQRLEAEYEYLSSDEVAEEMIQINEYEFTEDGNIH